MLLRRLSPLLLLSTGLLISCGEDEDPAGGGSSFGEIEFPKEFQTAATKMAIRLTGVNTTDEVTTKALNDIFNNRISLADMLMRGGLPDDPTELTGDITGTSPQMLKALSDNGSFPVDQGVDSCGNPVIASFITPDVAQYAFSDFSEYEQIWPDACGMDADCDDFKQGVIEVQLTKPRYDGMVDVIMSVHQDVHTNPPTPAMFGHLLGFLPTDNNPGFNQLPIFMNAKSANLMAGGLLEFGWSQGGYYGSQNTYVFPHTARKLSAKDVSVSLLGHELCDSLWNDFYTGEIPYGCDPEGGMTKPLQVETNSSLGGMLYETVFADGEDPTYIDKIADAFTYSMAQSIACPVGAEESWIRQGPVELFLCPSGEIRDCVARQDMEDAGCRATSDAPAGEFEISPLRASAPLLVPAAAPMTLIATDETAGIGEGDPAEGPPYYAAVAGVGGQTLVVYASVGFAVLDGTGADKTSQVVELLENTHCEGAGTKRYDLTFPANGTYYLSFNLSSGQEVQLMATDFTHFIP
ncbi:MAG: hypothetical protein JXX28_07375 [Deltaproteobacteria bacterium]|nr:hypothetical protein [Deltaproteobacteria bacterium]